MAKLTKKRMAFIDEYLKDFNGTQAAIRAGYSKKTAKSIASEILTLPDVSEAILERMTKNAMSADEVLRRLGDMARGDMGNFLDVNSMGIFNLDLVKAKKLGLLHLVKKVKDRSVMAVDKDGVESETHNIEVELYDAQAALVHIGKHHKLFTDKLDVKSDVVVYDLDEWQEERNKRKAEVEKIESEE